MIIYITLCLTMWDYSIYCIFHSMVDITPQLHSGLIGSLVFSYSVHMLITGSIKSFITLCINMSDLYVYYILSIYD